MGTITVKEFLEEMKKDWDCVEMVNYNYVTKKLFSYWVNRETLRYDEKEKRLHFKDWMKDQSHNTQIMDEIQMKKKQFSDCEITDYIIYFKNDTEVTFEAEKKF